MLIKDSISANRFLIVFISVLVLLSLSVAMAGAFSEADCEEGCAEENDNCCECICCPTKVVMTVAGQQFIQYDFSALVYAIDRIYQSGEQVWYGSIEHPPQNAF